MSPYPIQPGSNGTPPGFPQPGTVAGQNNPAADMIRNILTTPRPGGMPQGNPGGQTIGGGIAGVASTAEGEGVKVYNDRTLYQEWEFIYDPQKQEADPQSERRGRRRNSCRPDEQQRPVAHISHDVSYITGG